MKQKRLKPEVRKEAILDIALALAAKSHYVHVQRKQIAEKLKVTPPAISYHFSTMTQLHRAMARAAVARENLPVLAQFLMCGHEIAKKAPADLRREAMLWAGQQ